MDSTETPSERIAGDLALAAAEGVPAPSPARLATVYRGTAGDCTAALRRLEATAGARELLAAAAMCRRMEAIGGGLAIDPVSVGRPVTNAGEASRLLGEQFLAAARQPGPPGAFLAGRALEIIGLGRRAASVLGVPVDFPWAGGPAALSFPLAAGAALTSPGSAGRARAARPGTAAAPRRASR